MSSTRKATEHHRSYNSLVTAAMAATAVGAAEVTVEAATAVGAAITAAGAMAATVVEAAITAAVASAFSLVVAAVAAAAEAAVEATGAGSVVGWFGATDVTCHISGSP
jgi:hypothetical protein